MLTRRIRYLATALLRPNLGREIGRPLWFAQGGLFSLLVGVALWLGLTTTGTPVHTPQESAPPPPSLSEADRIALAFPLEVDGGTDRARVVLPEYVDPPPIMKTMHVRRGDTLAEIMQRAGIDSRTAYEAVLALRDVYDPRRLRSGQQITATFDADESVFEGLRIAADVDRAIVVSRDRGGFVAREEVIPLARQMARAGNVIDDSLYLAAERVGIPPQVIVELIHIFSFEVDFQRELRSGDRFEVYFETFEDDSGTAVKYGDIQFASLTLSGKELNLYRYSPADGGRTDYFHEDGRSARKLLMKTPIDGARLSSYFGRRKHPILGYTRMHEGLDFAAPTGTPIMAAGSGVVERANWYGGYGRYVRIRHNGTYKTAYAHMSAFGRGIKSGTRIKQGQIIGYVGTSGNSTGPHLHYEVHKYGDQVNPLKLKLPTGRTLEGIELARFQEMLEPLKTRIAATPMLTRVAARGE